MVQALKRFLSLGENSIRRDIRLFALGLAALVVVTYSVLLAYYFYSGLQGASSYQLQVIAASYEDALAREPDLPKSFSNITVSMSYAELSEKVKEIFPPSEIEPGEMIAEIEENEKTDKETLYLLLNRPLADGRDLYLVQTIHLDEPDRLNVEPYFQDYLRDVMLMVGAAFLIATYFAVRLLARRVVTPVQKLQDWAESLGDFPAPVEPPDFQYRELDAVADRLAVSIGRISGFVEREAAFLRHASHELRTPIAIISGNAALLARKESQSGDTVAVERIQRASHTMQQLVETLLWLGRENDPPPELKTIDLAAVTEDLADELGYLIGSKSITLEKNLVSSPMLLPEFPTRIVLSNLLRNAFQHTAEGSIFIDVHDGLVCVRNEDTTIQGVRGAQPVEMENGIGLSLVKRIARRLRWDFFVERSGNETTASLQFKSSA